MPRRRLYLMRHGSVDYFDVHGEPVPPDAVPLNEQGRAQAEAAGQAFARAGVRFDLAIDTGLPRTRETREYALAQCGGAPRIESIDALRELHPGRLADLPDATLESEFLDVFAGVVPRERRFLGGESFGTLLDRAVPAFERLLARGDWTTALLVAHGGTNIALLSTLLSGRPAFFGGMEQTTGAINGIDVGADGRAIVRFINMHPHDVLQHARRHTTMELVYAGYARARGAARERADG